METTSPSSIGVHPPGDGTLRMLLMILLPLTALLVLMLSGYWFHRLRKNGRFNELPTCEPAVTWSPTSPYVGLMPIQLLEVKAQGRFGNVWKARDSELTYVAVKIFPPQDWSSWQVMKR